MKKFTALAMSTAMALSLMGTVAAAEGVSGEFTGSAISEIGGEANPVTVTITLEDGVITDVQAEGPGETQGIGSEAIDKLPGEMVAGNTLAVDGVATATMTSNALKEAAANALTEAGLNPEDYMTASEAATEAGPAEDEVLEADLVVVGAGGAGMTAAITAADAGKTVVLLESQAMVGGNTVRSSGGLNAAGTPEQQELGEFTEASGVEKSLEAAKGEEFEGNQTVADLAATVQEQWDAFQANPEGYFDTPELMALDTIEGGHGTNDPELLKTLTENSAGAVAWLEEHGADLPSVGQAGGAAVRRIHRPLDENGKVIAVGEYIVPKLKENVEERADKITLLTSTNAESIIMDGDKAVGVEATGETGNKVTVNAKAVVIATGGFGANQDMVTEYRPDLKGVVTTNAAGAQGTGIVMTQAVGADTVAMDQIQVHPTVYTSESGDAHLITEGVRGDGAILVNKEGKRFFDEVSTRDKVSAAENEQTDGQVWLILDQKMLDASALYDNYINKYGYGVTGQTYEELGEAMGVPADVFAQTMADWAEIYANKEDPEFGRTQFSPENDLATAPYYAIPVAPGIHHTMGGLKIDSAAEVLNAEGTAIAGLFAAGEVTGGVHGNNRLGGTAVTDIIVFGQIAGNSAVDYIG